MPPLALLPNQPAGATDIVPTGGYGHTTDQQPHTMSSASGPDPYQSIIEAEKRSREESDRNFQVQLGQLKNQRAQIAIQQGQAAANAWYNQQQVLLTTQKLAEDKRQFDITTANGNQQFAQKQEELKRQFDLTTVEGRRQFDVAQAEEGRRFNLQFVNSQNEFQAKQAQYATSLGEQVREFDVSAAQTTAQMQEKARQFDLTRADGIDQFAKTFGLDEKKVAEQARQFDLSRADQVDQFAKSLAENSRQFNVTSSGRMADGTNTLARDTMEANTTGYYNGAATLGREQFQNQALFDWTKQAIDLASTPADWVKYKQMTSGVSENAGNIPGLAWTQGGQVGNTAFNGTPQANSLQHVLGQMGVQNPNGGAQGASGQESTSQGMPIYTGAQGQARPVGMSGDASGLQTGQAPTYTGPLAQGVYDKGAAPGQAPMQRMMLGAPGGSGQPQLNTAGAANPQQPMNWAYQAAGMIHPLNTATLSPAERQLYDTADQFSRNPQGAGAGWYENLDPNTREMLKGAAQAQGHDWTTVMSRFNRSKWGGGGSAAAA